MGKSRRAALLDEELREMNTAERGEKWDFRNEAFDWWSGIDELALEAYARRQLGLDSAGCDSVLVCFCVYEMEWQGSREGDWILGWGRQGRRGRKEQEGRNESILVKMLNW